MLHVGKQARLTDRPKLKKKRLPAILNRVPRRDADRIILSFLESLNTPRALTVWLLYNSGEHRQVVELTIDPHSYNARTFGSDLSIDRFRKDYCATKFLSKCVGLKTGINTKDVAIASAMKAEDLCRETNNRLRNTLDAGVNPDLNSKLFRASQIVARVLGPAPRSFEDVGWSPGRSSSSWGTEVSALHKYCSRLDVTGSALGRALRVVQDSPNWGAAAIDAAAPVSVLRSAFTLVQGNTLITVPKNAKTDRVICYEPHMNIRLQLAVGKFLRYRLLKHGVNLNDQSINQRRANLASRFGKLATIDLSQASDTVSYELVKALLPVDWMEVLDPIRSKYTFWPDGLWRRNEKFSSMGNGFTFELESLIFYALACVESENVSVYGDDIIVSTESFEAVKSLLADCGFSLNTAKSFATGRFRESCGHDAFAGVDCTPVYLRKIPNLAEDVVKLHNRVREWLARWDYVPMSWSFLLRGWRTSVPVAIGPQGYGDGHYHVDFQEACPQRAGNWVDGWWFKTYHQVSRCSTLYGDRVSGRFSEKFGFGALCAGTGPKRSSDVVASVVDRRLFTYRYSRGLASFTWPSIDWFH